MLVRQSNSPLFSLMSFNTLMMETVRTSETSVYSNETIRIYITEDSHLQGLSSKKTHKLIFVMEKLVFFAVRTTRRASASKGDS
jgi:hypothetical protein